MINSIKICLWRYFYIFFLITLTMTGCATPQTGKELQQTTEEEAYIDLKRNFTLVVPISWHRKKLPVSSPEHRTDSVRWVIPGTNHEESSLQIRVITPREAETLQESLATFLNSEGKKLSDKIEALQHPAGPALRLRTKNSANSRIYLAVGGQKQVYIIAFRLTATDFEKLLPKVEKVILSFSII